ncbi:MAG: hypothetical protein AAFR58_16930 [Cyanobacteria bacterium J06627_28]
MESSAVYFAQFESVDTIGTPIIAQHFDQDLIGDTGTLLKGFYESGQLWALLIGVVLGYGFKSFSSYG